MTTTPDTVVDVDAVLAQLIADPATASVPLVDLCAHLHHPAVAELRPDPLGNYLVLFALTEVGKLPHPELAPIVAECRAVAALSLCQPATLDALTAWTESTP